MSSLAKEQKRVAAVRKLGQVPKGCGPEIPDAPARGPVVQFTQTVMYPDGEDGFKAKDAGYLGRKSLRHADAFDIMAAGAARHKKPAPFTPAQVAMGRHYATLYERHASAGVRCSSMEAQSRSSGGGGGEYIDAVLRDRAQLDLLQARIGTGSAMVVRRQKPSERGSKTGITDKRLVDDFCLKEISMTRILEAHGWSKDGKAIQVLTQALCEALDRMAGPCHAPRAASVHYSEKSATAFQRKSFS